MSKLDEMDARDFYQEARVRHKADTFISAESAEPCAVQGGEGGLSRDFILQIKCIERRTR